MGVGKGGGAGLGAGDGEGDGGAGDDNGEGDDEGAGIEALVRLPLLQPAIAMAVRANQTHTLERMRKLLLVTKVLGST